MTIEFLLVGVLVTYRLTMLVVDESGPFDLFGHFRHWAGIRYDERSRKIATNQVAEMLICFNCTSIWIGIGVFALFWFIPSLQPFGLPFAFSGAAVFMRKWTG